MLGSISGQNWRERKRSGKFRSRMRRKGRRGNSKERKRKGTVLGREKKEIGSLT